MESSNPVRKEVEEFFKKKIKTSYVKLVPEKARLLAEKMIEEGVQLPNWRDNEHIKGVYVDDDKDAHKFFTIINSINFLFWNLITNQDGIKVFKRYTNNFGQIGSNEMFAIVKKNLDKLEPAYLEKITLNEMEKLFGNLPLLEERTKIFNEVGRVFKKYDKFEEFYKRNNNAFDNGEGLVELLVKEMPSFKDETRGVKFLKRAQLCVAILYGRLGPQKFPVKDINELTVFADYQVPKGLLHEGVIKYSGCLFGKIKNYELIKKDSVMELEIRASTVKACDIVVKELREMGKKDANNLHVDSHLWHSARANNLPYHLTETTAY